MSPALLRALVLGAALAMGCGGMSASEEQMPRPTSVLPDHGYATDAVAVVISGDGFLVKPTVPSAGGSAELDTRHRAWLGDRELTVAWVDTKRLHGTVPAGLEAGTYDLTVENALGLRGDLKRAYTVVPVFSVALSVDRASVNVGQAFALTLTLTNAGSGDLADLAVRTPVVASTGSGAARIASGPTPGAPARLSPGQQHVMRWTLDPTAPGTIAFDVSAYGRDVATGRTVTATPATATVSVVLPAALSAELNLSTSVAVGTDFTLTMTVENTGGGRAEAVAPAEVSVTGVSGARPSRRSGPTPQSASVPGGGSATFTWMYSAGASRGSLRVTGGASGRDANSGAALSATASPRTASVVNASSSRK